MEADSLIRSDFLQSDLIINSIAYQCGRCYEMSIRETANDYLGEIPDHAA